MRQSCFCFIILFDFISTGFPEPDTSNNESHGDQENPDRVHEEVQGSQMGDVFQMLRGLCEVSSDPAGDGAFPQALVLGGLGQWLRLQRLVHAEADQEQNCPSVPPTADVPGGEEEVVQPRTQTASWGWRDWGGSWWGGGRRRCSDCRWGNYFIIISLPFSGEMISRLIDWSVNRKSIDSDL